MNEIQKLRAQSGLSQSKFAFKLGIPVRTIQKWEIGQSSPPTYVINMIKTQLEGYEMINMETVYFISILNELATMTETEDGKPWILPFAECTSENQNDSLFYDEKNPMMEGDAGDDLPVYYDIILDKCVDSICHHDIISVYSNIFPTVTIRYRAPYYGDTGTIEVSTESEHDIMIHDGIWYTV